MLDHAHCFPKPKLAPDYFATENLARVHFYHIIEQLIFQARKKGSPLDSYSKTVLYPDFFVATLQARRQENSKLVLLQNENGCLRKGMVKHLLAFTFNLAIPDTMGRYLFPIYYINNVTFRIVNMYFCNAIDKEGYFTNCLPK